MHTEDAKLSLHIVVHESLAQNVLETSKKRHLYKAVCAFLRFCWCSNHDIHLLFVRCLKTKRHYFLAKSYILWS